MRELIRWLALGFALILVNQTTGDLLLWQCDTPEGCLMKVFENELRVELCKDPCDVNQDGLVTAADQPAWLVCQERWEKTQ